MVRGNARPERCSPPHHQAPGSYPSEADAPTLAKLAIESDARGSLGLHRIRRWPESRAVASKTQPDKFRSARSWPGPRRPRTASMKVRFDPWYLKRSTKYATPWCTSRSCIGIRTRSQSETPCFQGLQPRQTGPYRRSKFPRVAENKRFPEWRRSALIFGTIPVPSPGTNAGTAVGALRIRDIPQRQREYRPSGFHGRRRLPRRWFLGDVPQHPNRRCSFRFARTSRARPPPAPWPKAAQCHAHKPAQERTTHDRRRPASRRGNRDRPHCRPGGLPARQKKCGDASRTSFAATSSVRIPNPTPTSSARSSPARRLPTGI